MLTQGARLGVAPMARGSTATGERSDAAASQPLTLSRETTNEPGFVPVRRRVANLASALAKPEVIERFLEHETRDKRRICLLGHALPQEWHDKAYVSPLGVVPKANGKYRVIFHLSHGGSHSVNARIPRAAGYVPFLSLQQIASTLLAAGPELYFAVFDVEDAFRQLAAHPEDYHLLLMQWGDQYYVDTRVGFGSRTGPANYHKLGDAIQAVLHTHGVPCLRIADDHLIYGPSSDITRERMLRAHLILADIGIPRSLAKDFGPDHWADFNGIRWDARTWSAQVPPRRWIQIQEDVNLLLAGAASTPGTTLGQLRRVVGRLTAITAIVATGKAYLQSAYMSIADAQQAVSSTTRHSAPQSRASNNTLVQLSPATTWEFMWWKHTLSTPEPHSRPIQALAHTLDVPMTPSIIVTCDASGRALAAVWCHEWARVPVPPAFRFRPRDETALSRHRMANTSSTLLELGALLLAVCAWSKAWSGQHVLLRTDNQAAASIWRRRHSKHEQLAGIVRALVHYSSTHTFHLSIEWISGVDNTIADSVSRFNDTQFRDLLPGAAPHPTEIATPHPLDPWTWHCGRWQEEL